jgi:hypothetical protein
MPCSARAESGSAALVTRPAMNSRRLIQIIPAPRTPRLDGYFPI